MNISLIILFLIHLFAILAVYVEEQNKTNRIINFVLIIISMMLIIGAVSGY